jgi:hypothetical protein
VLCNVYAVCTRVIPYSVELVSSAAAAASSSCCSHVLAAAVALLLVAPRYCCMCLVITLTTCNVPTPKHYCCYTVLVVVVYTLQPDLEADYDSWAPSLSFMITKNIPTFLSGSSTDNSRSSNAIIVQTLGMCVSFCTIGITGTYST